VFTHHHVSRTHFNRILTSVSKTIKPELPVSGRGTSSFEHTRIQCFSVCVIPSTRCGEVPRPESGSSISNPNTRSR